MHAIVRDSLRSELQKRGYAVASDTVDFRAALYVEGEGDRAAAMFEFKKTAAEACETMYQGAWLPTMPPRFAVMPVTEQDDPGSDLLRQAGMRVLFYRPLPAARSSAGWAPGSAPPGGALSPVDGPSCVEFIDLDVALEDIPARHITAEEVTDR
jgi:hypothetical protein